MKGGNNAIMVGLRDVCLLMIGTRAFFSGLIRVKADAVVCLFPTLPELLP